MRFSELSSKGAYLIELDRKSDDRGFFARTFCEEEFAAAGLVSRFQQSSVSYNAQRGTVRGMHFQVGTLSETKIVRCVQGAVYDVIIDLRSGSPTYLQALGLELSAVNRSGLYIPAGFAHGFQTLEHDTELLYMIDVPHHDGTAGGLRWNDPAIKIDWPEAVTRISSRDLAFPDYSR